MTLKTLIAAQKIIQQFMPNAPRCFGVDFRLLNETQIDIAKLIDELKVAEQNKPGDEAPKKDLVRLLHEIHNWLVCSPIATPQDMAQSFDSFRQDIEQHLGIAGPTPNGWLWRDPETAPKNGTLLKLLVEFTDHQLNDDLAKQVTIGHNSKDDTGEDEWQFAGWCWSHDHYTEGKGVVIGWAPFDQTSEQNNQDDPRLKPVIDFNLDVILEPPPREETNIGWETAVKISFDGAEGQGRVWIESPSADEMIAIPGQKNARHLAILLNAWADSYDVVPAQKG